MRGRPFTPGVKNIFVLKLSVCFGARAGRLVSPSMNMPRCSAPWAVMVLLLSLILCSIRFTNQVRLRAASDTLQFERMKV